MKDYPSIPRANGQAFRFIPWAYLFSKLDGSMVRAQYSKKQGFYKFGTKTCLMDTTTPIFGEAIPLFFDTWAEPLTRIFKDNRWNDAIVFCEFYGAQSFAGIHVPNDPKRLSLFDVDVDKRGIMGPRDFLKHFEKLPIADFLGIQNWNRELIEMIYESILPGVSFEGVVGKAGEGHQRITAKAKTKRWLDAVKARYNEKDAEKIINS